MASFTIEKRAKANGDFSYRCTIRVKESGEIIHRESKTFSKRKLLELGAKPAAMQLKMILYCKRIKRF